VRTDLHQRKEEQQTFLLPLGQLIIIFFLLIGSGQDDGGH
jgi:hypothetical protein